LLKGIQNIAAAEENNDWSNLVMRIKGWIFNN
jgi:hypothetical protein